MTLISKSSFNPYKKANVNLFSEREKEIIQLICQEKTSKDIGNILFISDRTVEGVRARILEKMNVKTPAGVAIFAIKNSMFFIENIK